ncbi:hypothetical protein AB0N73_09125 [Microbacterium sp. NPDC089189]|uniref:hypothetical protein n=1 Tax=Microbacterium sp. NPDC089189 TaxID=3154972 RepID=UPI00343BAF3E
MSDPRQHPIDIGPAVLGPDAASGRWILRTHDDVGAAVTAGWAEWVRLATRIQQIEDIRRERELRGDAWDQGYAAGSMDETGHATNPFR